VAVVFERTTEYPVFWLSFLILALLLLEDFLVFSLLAQRTSGLDQYVGVYSALILGGLIIMIVLRLTSSHMPVAIMIITAGVLVRFFAVRQLPCYSDVLVATAEAAKAILSGENPYTQTFSVQLKEIFPYPPFEPIYYILFLPVDVRYGEVFASLVTLVILYMVGRTSQSKLTLPVLMLYSFSGVLVASAIDGTNDTSAGMLNALAIFLLLQSTRRRSFKILIGSGVASGLAVCFKQFSIFFAIFALICSKKQALNWKAHLSSFLATVSLICLPYLVSTPGEFLREVILVHVGERGYGPEFILYNILPDSLKAYCESSMWLTIYSAALLVLLVFFAHRTTGIQESLAYSTLVWLVSLFLGRYVALSYFAFLAPAVCMLALIKERPSQACRKEED